MNKPSVDQLIKLRGRIVESAFNPGNWEELGLLTGASDEIDQHPRLLRSLGFGDNDYPSNVLNVLRRIVDRDPHTLAVIATYMDEYFPENSTYISSKPSIRRISFAPNVFEIPTGHVQQDLVAVMMPFALEFRGVYDAIKRAATTCSLLCLRADDIWEESTIVQDIFNLIYRAQVVVVDFSGKNSNVMYETGIAHTLGKHVIPITQSFEDIPFDMRHHRVLKYLPNLEGLDKLSTELTLKLQQFSISLSKPSTASNEESDIPF